MFENLTEKLQRTFKNLRGQGKLTDEHLDVALGEIREALLEGDVNVGVADELLVNIRKQALGSEVMLQLSPDQQVVKVVRDELSAMLGKNMRSRCLHRGRLRLWMIVGLQGSGKTTTTGKLAKWLVQQWAPAAGGFDGRVPAGGARAVGAGGKGGGNGAVAWGAGTDKPLEIVKGAIREAKLSASDVILVDTAGRLHIDDDLMNELSMLKKELQPSEILFIADAMIGQDAVRSAGRGEFHKRLGLNRRHSDEAGWRCARRGGAFDWESDWSAGEVRGVGRKVRRAGRILSGADCFACAGDGRHHVADRAGGADG